MKKKKIYIQYAEDGSIYDDVFAGYKDSDEYMFISNDVNFIPWPIKEMTEKLTNCENLLYYDGEDYTKTELYKNFAEWYPETTKKQFDDLYNYAQDYADAPEDVATLLGWKCRTVRGYNQGDWCDVWSKNWSEYDEDMLRCCLFGGFYEILEKDRDGVFAILDFITDDKAGDIMTNKAEADEYFASIDEKGAELYEREPVQCIRYEEKKVTY